MLRERIHFEVNKRKKKRKKERKKKDYDTGRAVECVCS
jgi:hypothetical protein